jgi:hypothetical protein
MTANAAKKRRDAYAQVFAREGRRDGGRIAERVRDPRRFGPQHEQ